MSDSSNGTDIAAHIDQARAAERRRTRILLCVGLALVLLAGAAVVNSFTTRNTVGDLRDTVAHQNRQIDDLGGQLADAQRRLAFSDTERACQAALSDAQATAANQYLEGIGELLKVLSDPATAVDPAERIAAVDQLNARLPTLTAANEQRNTHRPGEPCPIVPGD